MLSLVLPLAMGFLIALLLTEKDREIGVYERIFLGYGIGMGLVAVEVFWIGLLGIPYTLLSISAVPATSCLALIVWIRHFHITDKAEPNYSIGADTWSIGADTWSMFTTPQRVIATLLMIWIFAKIVFVIYEGLHYPLFSWDTWANWSAGAKFFYYRQGLALDPADVNFFGTGYRSYLGHPLLSPLLQVWTSYYVGEFHEALAKAWQSLYFVSLLGLFFFAVKRATSLLMALLATTLLAAVPLLTFHAFDGYSDLPLGFYAFAGTACFWRYIISRNDKMLVLSGIFAGIGMFTKNEGLFFVVATALSLTCYSYFKKTNIKRPMLCFLVPVLAVSGPWIVFKLVFNLGYGHHIAQQFVGYDMFLTAIVEMLKVFFLEANFNIVIALFVLTIVLNGRVLMKDDIKYLFIIIAFVGTLFFGIYVFSEQEFRESLVGRMAVNRNILTYISIVYFYTSLALHKTWYRERSGLFTR